MSRLEAFRKQAKQLVRWHREGNYSIGGRIRGLERYRQLTDVQALRLPFPLSEAQEIIAREAGFDGWAALKIAMGHESPGAKPPGERPTLKMAIPLLLVASVADAAAFFRDKLGFTIDFLHGHPAFYGGVSRDGVTLHLRFVHQDALALELERRKLEESLLAAFIVVENVKALFEEYKLKGVEFDGTLHKEPWGGPMFYVRGPDGNLLLFCA